MDEDISRPIYVERKGGDLHPAVDRKRLNMMMMIYIYFYIYTLAAIILKIFEPNFIMLFLGLIARLSSLMSKICPSGWSGERVEILKIYIYIFTR